VGCLKSLPDEDGEREGAAGKDGAEHGSGEQQPHGPTENITAAYVLSAGFPIRIRICIGSAFLESLYPDPQIFQTLDQEIQISNYF